MYALPPLPYPYNELEPYIDARTMEIHYTKHHQAYVDNLNKALADYPEFQAMPLETLLVSLDKIPVVIRDAVRNNGGGHFAHSLFWKIMGKPGQGDPAGELAKAIEHDFNSFANLKKLLLRPVVIFCKRLGMAYVSTKWANWSLQLPQDMMCRWAMDLSL